MINCFKNNVEIQHIQKMNPKCDNWHCLVYGNQKEKSKLKLYLGTILYVFQLSDIYNSKEGTFQIETSETTAAGFCAKKKNTGSNVIIPLGHSVLWAVLESFLHFVEGSKPSWPSTEKNSNALNYTFKSKNA